MLQAEEGEENVEKCVHLGAVLTKG